MPVAPTARKPPSSFSIESLMGRSDPPSTVPVTTPSAAVKPRRSPSPRSPPPSSPATSPKDASAHSPPAPARSSSPPAPREGGPRPEVGVMGGLRSSFHPVTPGASAFLHGLRLKGLPPGHELPGLEGIQHHLHPHLPPLGVPGHPHGPLGHFPGPHPTGVVPPRPEPLDAWAPQGDATLLPLADETWLVLT